MRVVFDGPLDLAAWMLKPVPVTILDDVEDSGET